MPIFPLPPGLLARLNLPPTYKTATADTAPPAYIEEPLNRMSTFRPESIPLPPSPSPSPSPSPAPATTISIPTTSTQQTPPPEYSPSVYSQHQRLSHYLPPTADPNSDANTNPSPADLGFPSSPRRPSAASGKWDHQHHASHFQESWTDLSVRVDLENASAAADAGAGVEEGKAGKGKKSVFRLYPPVKEGEVERLYWKRGVVAVGLGVLVVVVVAVVVGAGVYGRK